MVDSVGQGDFDELAPRAAAMIESMRAYGYTLATAIADLVDNSVTAGAANVWLDAWWAGRNSWITLTDDGHGMFEHELRDAMRLGSRSPLEARMPSDLGRFGLGLKTASLSQCRRLTVISRRSECERHIRRWDLDHLSRRDVHGWQLLRSVHPDSTAPLDRFDRLECGTTVLWEDLDRLVSTAHSDDKRVQDHFLRSLQDVEQHLAMVFHRHLEGPRKRLRIFVNGNELAPWDPFLEHHPATTSTPEERIELPGHDSPIVFRGFVLPHKDRLSDAEHAAAAGPTGWSGQQGFYLYRNERLIVPGSWLGMRGTRAWTKEEHYKLARIRLDVPNSMDHLWHLDVKKSHATPPPLIRERLVGLAQNVRQSARDVFAHRGKYGKRAAKKEYERPWKVIRLADRVDYRIDRDHPLVAAVLSDLPADRRSEAEVMLRVIEETVPVQQIWLDAAESPQDTSAPFAHASSQDRVALVLTAYRAIRRNRGLDHEATLGVLRACEEFADDETEAILASYAEGLNR
ncbi:MAG: ATP-binding protein [Deltaproteobacteria bacterium]|nr:ATP-binding protein [Deltaproteobacteria bacterium]